MRISVRISNMHLEYSGNKIEPVKTSSKIRLMNRKVRNNGIRRLLESSKMLPARCKTQTQIVQAAQLQVNRFSAITTGIKFRCLSSIPVWVTGWFCNSRNLKAMQISSAEARWMFQEDIPLQPSAISMTSSTNPDRKAKSSPLTTAMYCK